MNEDGLRALEAEKLLAEVAREVAETRKIDLEVKKLDSQINGPFYSSKEFLRPIVAGISLALLLAAYIGQVFVPTLDTLSKKAETAEFVLQENAAHHSAQMARLELLKARIEVDVKTANLQLAAAKLKLDQAEEMNSELQARIEKRTDNCGLDKFKSRAMIGGKEILSQGSKIEDQKLEIAGLDAAAEEKGGALKGTKGWIYVGQFSDKRWDDRRIEIAKDATMIAEGTTHKLSRNVNLRIKYPKLTLFGYELRATKGVLIRGQNVVVKEVEIVGLSKVWASVVVAK